MTKFKIVYDKRVNYFEINEINKYINTLYSVYIHSHEIKSENGGALRYFINDMPLDRELKIFIFEVIKLHRTTIDLKDSFYQIYVNDRIVNKDSLTNENFNLEQLKLRLGSKRNVNIKIYCGNDSVFQDIKSLYYWDKSSNIGSYYYLKIAGSKTFELLPELDRLLSKNHNRNDFSIFVDNILIPSNCFDIPDSKVEDSELDDDDNDSVKYCVSVDINDLLYGVKINNKKEFIELLKFKESITLVDDAALIILRLLQYLQNKEFNLIDYKSIYIDIVKGGKNSKLIGLLKSSRYHLSKLICQYLADSDINNKVIKIYENRLLIYLYDEDLDLIIDKYERGI